MKSLGVLGRQDYGEYWQAWIAALYDSGFEIRLIHRRTVEDQSSVIERVDAVLVDGSLSCLSQLIEHVSAHFPDAKIIVATEVSSFEIYYDVVQLGAYYLAEPASSQHFVQTIRRIVSDNEPFETFSMPRWCQ